jgi:hypothetical protein
LEVGYEKDWHNIIKHTFYHSVEGGCNGWTR